jgi:hypothetical protein
MTFVDHVAAGFGVLAFGEALAQRPHASADAVAPIDDDHVRAERREVAGSREPREARARHEHRYTVKGVGHITLQSWST